MGDPRKTRKKYETPRHPWIAGRITQERELKKKFGTKSKREIWKMDSALKRFKNQAKTLVSRNDDQAKKEHEQMMTRMISLGLIKPGASLDDILSLSVNDMMSRRLQTILVKRLLARTPKQARQLIVHGHVIVGDKIVTSPSYLVKAAEETQISFRTNSPFSNDAHPERFSETELKAKEERAQAKSAKKKTSDEEAPPTFNEEDVADPEQATSKKEVESKAKSKKAEVAK